MTVAEGRVATPRPKVESPWISFPAHVCIPCRFMTCFDTEKAAHEQSNKHLQLYLAWTLRNDESLDD